MSTLNPNAPEFIPLKNKTNNQLEEKTNKYKQLIEKLEKYNKITNEMAHIIQDDIYRTFIKDIHKGYISTPEEIKTISTLIVKRVIPLDKDRWYS